MKIEDMILNSIFKTASGMQIPESKLFETVDAHELSTLQYAKLCETITMHGYEIVSDQETVQSHRDPYESVLLEFNKLELTEKYKCLIKLALNIAADDEQAQKAIAEQFVQQVLNMHLQYSYIAVFLKAFFAHCNALGRAKLLAMIRYAEDFYRGRQETGLISEKSDSILSRPGFDAKDVKRIALFNPLKRSFVEKYFEYDNLEKIISINEALWDSLSNYDKTEILRACDEKLNTYYKRIGK